MSSVAGGKSVSDMETQTFLPMKKIDTIVCKDDGVKVIKDDALNGQMPQTNIGQMLDGKSDEQVGLTTVLPGEVTTHSPHAVGSDEVLNLSCRCGQKATRCGYMVMAVMLMSNIVNYMDRFTIAGLLHFKLIWHPALVQS